jgi:LacI family transcriptional regulator
VAESTKVKIRKIIDELNYKPNILASTLASKKSVVFATLMPKPPSDEGYWNKPFLGAKRRVAELEQYNIQIKPFCFNQFDSKSFVVESEKILELKPDGIVMAPFFKKEALLFIEQLKENKIPFVFIDSEIKDAGQISYIGQDSFQSGMVSGKLLSLILPEGNILVIHFAKEMDNQNHLVQREKGFYNWFKTNKKLQHKLLTIEVPNIYEGEWMKEIADIIIQNNYKGIFVTNSKVTLVAQIIEKYKFNNIKIIGHDLLKENVEYLKKDIVQFLISQSPETQGYNAVNKLFKNIVEKKKIAKKNYTSIDIITKENFNYYKEFK